MGTYIHHRTQRHGKSKKQLQYAFSGCRSSEFAFNAKFLVDSNAGCRMGGKPSVCSGQEAERQVIVRNSSYAVAGSVISDLSECVQSYRQFARKTAIWQCLLTCENCTGDKARVFLSVNIELCHASWSYRSPVDTRIAVLSVGHLGPGGSFQCPSLYVTNGNEDTPSVGFEPAISAFRTVNMFSCRY